MVLRDPEGETTYGRLAQLAVGLERPRVLDVACGDGVLLEQVRTRAPDARLAGVDFSEAELSLARDRVPHAQIEHGRAQALPFDAAAFDVVLCHMAFMLFDSVPQVVAEFERVLRPGGALGLVVGARPAASSPMAVYRASIHACSPGSEAMTPSLGDARARASSGLRALLSPRFEVGSIERVEVSRRVPRARVWESCEDLYNHARRGREERARLKAHLLASLVPDAAGEVVDAHAVLHVVARRRGGEGRL